MFITRSSNALAIRSNGPPQPLVAAVHALIVTMLVTVAPATAQSIQSRFAKHTAGSTATVDHSIWDRQTKAYVVTGPDRLNRVRYAAWKKEGRADLERYLALLQSTNVDSLDRREQMAFWTNLYNAKTIAIVLEAHPVKSIKDISLGGTLLARFTGGPWKAKVMKVAGVDLSLDDVEHAILRPIFKDPRIHYAVNCASIGCPNLMRGALNGANLEAQLDAGAKAYVNHARGISVNGGKVTASSIYDWFQEDFGGSAKSVLDHVRRYAAPELLAKLKGIGSIDAFGYDWALNETDG